MFARAVSLFLLFCSGFASAQQTAEYPLHVSADDRHLEDSVGAPFLINGATPWSLIVVPTKSEAIAYLDDRVAKGFNSIIIELIEHQFGGPNNSDGDRPFQITGDFSTPNDAYFDHAEWVVARAAERNLLVVMAPAYLGYECGNEGWCQEVTSTSKPVLREYGRYVANRFLSYPNIIWLHGGDVDAGNYGALDEVNEIVAGIKEIDSVHLHTAHCGPGLSAIDCYDEPWLDVNTTYVRDCTNVASATRTDYQRSRKMPFFFLEGLYENEGANQTCLRWQAYTPVLGGSVGSFFGNRPIWLFDSGWQQALNSSGAVSMEHFDALIRSRAWEVLEPDWDQTTVTTGRGSIGSSNYAAAARSSGGETVIAYIPSSRDVVVDTTTIAGSAVRAWRYNPANGSAEQIGTFAKTSSQVFSPSGNGDWVLVVDNADSGLPAPGSDVPTLTQCEDGLDNDLDSLIDFPADPGCDSASDDDETNIALAQCEDGSDNDGDGLIDFPADPGCDSASDDDETNIALAQCEDGSDNDGDGLIDFPADPGCDSASDDDETNIALAQCEDGSDNDGDGLIDFPADPGCDSASDDDETNIALAQCEDGSDNDGDGLIDFPADPGCDSASDDDETNITLAQCEDGSDNDGDGLIDFPADPGCDSASDDDETNITLAQCEDGSDNDGDGLIDFPADPGCDSASDDDETNIALAQCEDGSDNDGDGLIDFPADPGCDSASDDDELNIILAQCEDGLDNDLDGLIDFSADPGCDSAMDNDESNDPAPMQCGDGIDNDLDGLTDFPADPGCDNAADNDETDIIVPQCEDGIDNDLDGLTDFPADPGCDNAADNDETNITLAQCEDGIDNDLDGLTDFPADRGCDNAADNDETNIILPQCEDGIDNDLDGLTDFPADPGCDSTSDNDETNIILPQCEDGIDNDLDGLTDFPADPGCDNAADNDETNIILAQCQDGIDNDFDGLTDFPTDPGCSSALDGNEGDDPQLLPPLQVGGSGAFGPVWLYAILMMSLIFAFRSNYPIQKVRWNTAKSSARNTAE